MHTAIVSYNLSLPLHPADVGENSSGWVIVKDVRLPNQVISNNRFILLNLQPLSFFSFQFMAPFMSRGIKKYGSAKVGWWEYESWLNEYQLISFLSVEHNGEAQALLVIVMSYLSLAFQLFNQISIMYQQHWIFTANFWYYSHICFALFQC